MSKHTPGPWKFGQYTVSDIFDSEDLARNIAMHPDYFEVASEFDANYKRLSISGHIGEDNARLIAAAPDLFASLDKLLERYERIAESGDAGFWDFNEEPVVINARKALAKALGADAIESSLERELDRG